MAIKTYTTIADKINVVPTTNWRSIKGMDWGGNSLSFSYSGDGSSVANWQPSYQYTSSGNTTLTSLTNCTIDDAPLIFSGNSITSIDNVAITDWGYCAFASNLSLTSATNMTVSKDQSALFQYCTGLTSFQGSTSAVTNGRYMFWRNFKLTSIDTDNFDSMKNGQNMFNGCSSLTEFNYALPALTGAVDMFCGAGIKSFTQDLTALTNGKEMFYGSAIESFSGNLPNMTTGIGMFAGCASLQTLNLSADSLTDAMVIAFGCSNLTSVDLRFASATSLSGSVADCSALTTANIYAPSVTNAYMMCAMNSGSGSLTSVTANVASVTEYNSMFQFQYNLNYCELIVPSALSAKVYTDFAIPTDAPCKAYRSAEDLGDGTWKLIFSTGSPTPTYDITTSLIGLYADGIHYVSEDGTEEITYDGVGTEDNPVIVNFTGTTWHETPSSIEYVTNVTIPYTAYIKIVNNDDNQKLAVAVHFTRVYYDLVPYGETKTYKFYNDGYEEVV